MSGPVAEHDENEIPSERINHGIDVLDSRETAVGNHVVRRALPRRGRRTVGPWCFLDHLTPFTMDPANQMEVGPHPHIGLQTVTWLLEGEAIHRDSLGSEQVIRPGQLNLMSAGNGIAHAEQSTRDYGVMHGVQLWIAQPDATRFGPPAFEHHASLPQAWSGNADFTLLNGSFAGLTSSARCDSPTIGVDIALHPGKVTLPLDQSFEHAVVVLSGHAALNGVALDPDQLAYIGTGRDEISLSSSTETRLLLIGGAPFTEPLFMWWNYVARTREEVEAANSSWQAHDDRFGTVDSPLPTITAPKPQWIRS
jgi:redox-sensitive bicupin YhaK (pirin superfamily)